MEKRIANEQKATSIQNRKRYYAIAVALVFLWNLLIFYGGEYLSRNIRHWDLTLPVDSLVPVLPWMILFYAAYFLWCPLIYWLMTGMDRREADRFFCANLLGKAVCFLFFVFFPATYTRPALSGETIWENILLFLYQHDRPTNLFPSIHCMVSWLCWIGVRGKKTIPFWARLGIFMMALTICVSTLTVRQHVLVDVPAGILLAEICYRCCGAAPLRGFYSALTDSLDGFLTSFRHKAAGLKPVKRTRKKVVH